MWEYDVTVAVAGSVNTLAVEVFPATHTDLSITFVDWNPLPADNELGLLRNVYILASGPAALRQVQVASKVPLAFFVHIRLLKGANGTGIAPILWGDNYVSLVPDKKREIAGTYDR